MNSERMTRLTGCAASPPAAGGVAGAVGAGLGTGAMRRSLGRYELTRELGRGGMGVVWAAYDRDHGREVAIKLLAPRSRGAELTTLERRFLREARLTSRLDHPGIPAVP